MATISTPRPQSPAPGTPRIKSPSIAETPTSSTRGSVDLNVRPQLGQPRRTNRAALRDYYNLKSKPGAVSGGLSRTDSITSITSDTSTAPSVATGTDHTSTTSSITAPLDTPTFNAEDYISHLLATNTLRDILKVEATLVSEIRNLDGERKALVYDNYSKLIKAVGTIGEMQRGMNDKSAGGLREVGELEGRVGALREGVKDLVGGERDEGAKEARKRRKEARGAVRRREVVKWVLDAPNRLEMMAEEGRREQAEKEWKTVQGYLEKWQGVVGVEEVKKRCEQVMVSSDEQNGQHEG